ncbi:hypothetical protein HK101_009637 [Irineochytrium annulatum]|nr:hypothetical protein HK101_009637 [Irineochytrium annulatum]
MKHGTALSVICICSGITSLFGNGLVQGGPVVMTWGWLIVAAFTMCVGLSMAEICSAFPTSGGLYFYAARLTSPKYKPFASWITGWFNLLGQIAVTAGVVFGVSLLICATASVASIDSTGAINFTAKPGQVVGVHVAVAVTAAFANSFGTKVIARIMYVSTIWQVAAPFIIFVTLLAKAPTRQSAMFVFTDFENGTGIQSNAWAALVGLLFAQYTFTGYDSSAHVTEETRRADVAGPLGIVLSIAVSAVVGFLFIIAFLFSMQDYAGTVGTATGLPVAQIMLDACGQGWAVFMLVILIVATWFAAVACFIGNSRMIYAFSRDGALPLSSVWHTITQPLGVPLYANWLAATLIILLALPYLGNPTAFTAITSIATIGLYISYGSPIVCKLLNPTLFKPGPFHLGRWSTAVNVVSCAWIGIITALFLLPTTNPVTSLNMNYACVLVGAVFFGAGGAWLLSARKWFKGPVINLSEAEKKEVVLDSEETTVVPDSTDDFLVVQDSAKE